LQNIPDAPADNQYYAWLLNGGEGILPVHWTFTVHNGHVSSRYIDPQHMNLLTNRSALFLITWQNVDTTVPLSPRRYYASIPQTQPLANGLSLVVHQCPQSSSNNVCGP